MRNIYIGLHLLAYHLLLSLTQLFQDGLELLLYYWFGVKTIVYLTQLITIPLVIVRSVKRRSNFPITSTSFAKLSNETLAWISTKHSARDTRVVFRSQHLLPFPLLSTPPQHPFPALHPLTVLLIIIAYMIDVFSVDTFLKLLTGIIHHNAL